MLLMMACHHAMLACQSTIMSADARTKAVVSSIVAPSSATIPTHSSSILPSSTIRLPFGLQDGAPDARLPPMRLFDTWMMESQRALELDVKTIENALAPTVTTHPRKKRATP